MVQPVLRHPAVAVGASEDQVREGEARIEVDGLAEFSYGRLELARYHVDVARHQMRPGVFRIALNCVLRYFTSACQTGRGVHPAEFGSGSMHPRKQAVGARIVRIDADGPLEERLGDVEFARRTP